MKLAMWDPLGARMLTVDDVILILWALFFTVVLTVNVFLLLLMLRHTPRSFANFGIVMKAHGVSDIQTIVAAAAVMNRTIPIEHAYVYIAHGPCTLVSPTACFVTYGLMTMGASMTLYIVLVSFIVRLQIMKNRKPSDNSIIALLVIFSFPVPLAILILFLCSRSEDSVMRAILEDRLPEYASGDATIFGMEDIRIPTMSTSLALMIGVIIPLYCIILLLRRVCFAPNNQISPFRSRILKCLSETGDFLSERTKNMHAQFVKMLTLQCAIPPVVFVVTLVPFYLQQLDIIRHPLVEAINSMLACLSILLSPLIVLFLIRPYRRAMKRLIEGREKPLSLSINPESTLFLETRTTDS